MHSKYLFGEVRTCIYDGILPKKKILKNGYPHSNVFFDLHYKTAIKLNSSITSQNYSHYEGCPKRSWTTWITLCKHAKNTYLNNLFAYEI